MRPPRGPLALTRLRTGLRLPTRGYVNWETSLRELDVKEVDRPPRDAQWQSDALNG